MTRDLQAALPEDLARRIKADEVMACFQRRAADIENAGGKAAQWRPGVNDYRVPQSLEELGPRDGRRTTRHVEGDGLMSHLLDTNMRDE